MNKLKIKRINDKSNRPRLVFSDNSKIEKIINGHACTEENHCIDCHYTEYGLECYCDLCMNPIFEESFILEMMEAVKNEQDVLEMTRSFDMPEIKVLKKNLDKVSEILKENKLQEENVKNIINTIKKLNKYLT